MIFETQRVQGAGMALLLALALNFGSLGAEADRQWHQWRGPLANGVAPFADPPLEWSETQGIKWKVSVPGFGTSTPIIWGNRVFVLSAQPLEGEGRPQPEGRARGGPAAKHDFLVLCYERQSGRLLWQKSVRQEIPHEGHHQDHGYASASPITDGEHVYAYFGSRGLHCLDFDGNIKWSKDFPRFQTRNSFGEGTSPALHGNILVVCCDDETDNDFIVAVDKRTGKELWRTRRDEATSWSTPLIVEHQGRAEVIVNATGKARSYRLETGAELWSCGGQTANVIPTPVASADTVYLTSGFRGSAIMAVALGKSGDLTGTDAIRWSRARNTPYVPTPLLTGDLLYLITGNNGVLSCLDAWTGQPHFEGERLEGITGIYASPVAAKDRMYVLGRNGLCLVLKKGPALEVLASNKLDDRTDASIAMVEGELFIRGHKSLYSISR